MYYRCWRCVCLHTGYKVVAFKYMLLTLLLLRILKFQVSLRVPLQAEPLKMSAVGHPLCVRTIQTTIRQNTLNNG